MCWEGRKGKLKACPGAVGQPGENVRFRLVEKRPQENGWIVIVVQKREEKKEPPGNSKGSPEGEANKQLISQVYFYY